MLMGLRLKYFLEVDKTSRPGKSLISRTTCVFGVVLSGKMRVFPDGMPALCCHRYDASAMMPLLSLANEFN
jgi:hypothetical protein